MAGSLATILRSFKAASTRAIRDRVGERMIVWQSRFYDRRIWDERTLKVVRRYIADNPREWQERTCPWIRKHQAEEGASLRCRIDGTAQDTLDESLNKALEP